MDSCNPSATASPEDDCNMVEPNAFNLSPLVAALIFFSIVTGLPLAKVLSEFLTASLLLFLIIVLSKNPPAPKALSAKAYGTPAANEIAALGSSVSSS